MFTMQRKRSINGINATSCIYGVFLLALLFTPCLGHAQSMCVWPLNWDYMGYITDNDAQFSGMVYNPTYVSGHSTNYATDFGSAGYAELEDDDWLANFSSAYTISCWFKRPDYDFGGIFKRAESIDSGPCEISIFTQQNYVLVSHTNGGNNYTVSFDGGIGINTWYYITVTWDGTTLRLYVNAQEKSIDASYGGPISPGTGGICFLKYDNMYGTFYGALEDFIIADCAFDLSTVQTAMSVNW